MVLQVISIPHPQLRAFIPHRGFRLYRKDLFVGKVKRGHRISRNGHKNQTVRDDTHAFMAALPSVGCKRRAAMLKRTLCAAFAVAVLVAFSVPAFAVPTTRCVSAALWKALIPPKRPSL